MEICLCIFFLIFWYFKIHFSNKGSIYTWDQKCISARMLLVYGYLWALLKFGQLAHEFLFLSKHMGTWGQRHLRRINHRAYLHVTATRGCLVVSPSQILAFAGPPPPIASPRLSNTSFFSAGPYTKSIACRRLAPSKMTSYLSQLSSGRWRRLGLWHWRWVRSLGTRKRHEEGDKVDGAVGAHKVSAYHALRVDMVTRQGAGSVSKYFNPSFSSRRA
jgi:hypothetical protein